MKEFEEKIPAVFDLPKFPVHLKIDAVIDGHGEDIHEAIVNARRVAKDKVQAAFPGATMKVTQATKAKEA